MFTANSHVNDRVEQFEAASYKEANSLFRNVNGKFVEVDAGLSLAKAHRGAAFADFDGDGRIDAVVSALGEAAELYENVTTQPGHWIIVKLQGTRSNRDGIGVKIRLGAQYAEMTTTQGYASSGLTGVHFGLGSQTQIPKIDIRWPSGATQTLTNVLADQVLKVVEPN